MKQADSRKEARRSRPHTGQRRQNSGKTKTAKISPQDVLGTNPTRENSSSRNLDQEQSARETYEKATCFRVELGRVGFITLSFLS
jgi:hypothetical protein